MKSQTDLEAQLGSMNAIEMEELDLVSKNIQLIIDDPKINLANIEYLEDCENTLRILKSKFYKRLIHMMKINHMVT